MVLLLSKLKKKSMNNQNWITKRTMQFKPAACKDPKGFLLLLFFSRQQKKRSSRKSQKKCNKSRTDRLLAFFLAALRAV